MCRLCHGIKIAHFRMMTVCLIVSVFVCFNGFSSLSHLKTIKPQYTDANVADSTVGHNSNTKKNEMRLMPKQKRESKIYSHQKFMNIKIQRQRHSDTQTQTKKMSIIKVLPFGFRSSHEPSM